MTVKDAKVLQEVGTDLFRARVDPDIWIKCLKYQIQEEQPEVALITDMRFPNELEWITKSGGITVLVNRVLDDGTQYIAADRPSDHVSENSLDERKFSHSVIVRSGDFVGLREAAFFVYQTIQDKLRCL
jgi:hypothetical protein